MIRRNPWTSKRLIHGIMWTIFDMIHDNGIRDAFGTVPAGILDRDDGPKSTKPKSEPVASVIPAEA